MVYSSGSHIHTQKPTVETQKYVGYLLISTQIVLWAKKIVPLIFISLGSLARHLLARVDAV